MPEGVSETEQVVTIDRSPYPEAIWARAIVARCDGIGRHPRVRELGINHLGLEEVHDDLDRLLRALDEIAVAAAGEHVQARARG